MGIKHIGFLKGFEPKSNPIPQALSLIILQLKSFILKGYTMENVNELLKVLANETEIAIATQATLQVALANIAKTFKVLREYLTDMYLNDMLTSYGYNEYITKARAVKENAEKEIISIYDICEF